MTLARIRRFAAALAAPALLASFAPVPAVAQNAPAPATALAPAPVPAPAPAIPLKPALWKVSDADTTIYLFGTIHLLPQGMTWLQGPVATAFDGSAELVTEIPEIDDGSAKAVLLSRAMMPQGKTLRSIMTADERAKLETAMGKYGLPPASFDAFKPWYAAVVLATVPLMREGYNIDNGVEAELSARAAKAGRPRTGLETLDYQLGLFDGLPEAVQKKYLLEVIDALPSLREDVTAIITHWASGDAAKLAELMNADEDDPAMIEALLLQRNRTWAKWIKTRLDQPGTVFIAVGAGHLGGTGSVQDELGKLGVASPRVQ